MPQMIINTTAAQASRIAKAFGTAMGTVDNNENARDATAAEIKAHVIQFIKETVGRIEKNKAANAARDAIDEIKPT